MNCPRCGSDMRLGAATIGINPRSGYLPLALRIVYAFWPRADRLWFAPIDRSEPSMVTGQMQAQEAWRCEQCKLTGPEKPQRPPQWTVRISEKQQGKTTRKAVYDALRRHRVPHPIASPAANTFHAGGTSEVVFKDAVGAQAVATDLQTLGITTEVISPPPVQKTAGAAEVKA